MNIKIIINQSSEFEWILPFAIYAKNKNVEVSLYLNIGLGLICPDTKKIIQNEATLHGIKLDFECYWGKFLDSLFWIIYPSLFKVDSYFSFRLKPSEKLLKIFSLFLPNEKGVSHNQSYVFIDNNFRYSPAYLYFKKTRKVVVFPHGPGIFRAFSYASTIKLNKEYALWLEGSKLSDLSLALSPYKTSYIGLPRIDQDNSRYGFYDFNSGNLLLILQKRTAATGFDEDEFLAYLTRLSVIVSELGLSLFVKTHIKTPARLLEKYFSSMSGSRPTMLSQFDDCRDIPFRAVLSMFSTAGVYYVSSGIPVFHLNPPLEFFLTDSVDKAYYFDDENEKWTTTYSDSGLFYWLDDLVILKDILNSPQLLEKIRSQQSQAFLKYWGRGSCERILKKLKRI